LVKQKNINQNQNQNENQNEDKNKNEIANESNFSFAKELNSLKEMGFDESENVKTVLIKHKGNVDRVIQELLTGV